METPNNNNNNNDNNNMTKHSNNRRSSSSSSMMYHHPLLVKLAPVAVLVVLALATLQWYASLLRENSFLVMQASSSSSSLLVPSLSSSLPSQEGSSIHDTTTSANQTPWMAPLINDPWKAMAHRSNNRTTTTTTMFDQGGIVVFYHIPKTGGTSIRTYFNKHPKVKCTRMANVHDLYQESQNATMQQILNDTTHDDHHHRRGGMIQTYFIELHGNVPGLPALSPWLQHWRHQAKRLGKDFFAFTLLRDPVPFTISYFKHFHGLNCRWPWCEASLYNVTEPQNLVASMRDNSQCLELFHGQREGKKRPDPRPAVTARDCLHHVPLLLAQDWDFVGTTEALSTVLIPRLASWWGGTRSKILERESTENGGQGGGSGDGNVWTMAKINSSNESALSTSLHGQPLSGEMVQAVLKRSSLDLALYMQICHERATVTNACDRTSCVEAVCRGVFMVQF